MINYIRFKLMGGKIYLKDHVVPHIFECQNSEKLISPLESGKPTRKSRKSSFGNEQGQKAEPEFRVLIPSKSYSKNKPTQTICVNQRTISIQCEPVYKNESVQTDAYI